MSPELEPLLTPEEVCAILRISQPTFYRMARSGRLPAAKIGAEWRMKPSLLNRHIELRTVKPRTKGKES